MRDDRIRMRHPRTGNVVDITLAEFKLYDRHGWEAIPTPAQMKRITAAVRRMGAAAEQYAAELGYATTEMREFVDRMNTIADGFDDE